MQKHVIYLAKITSTVVLFLMTISPVTGAGMYKWVDKDGNVNYTQTPPPPGITATTVKQPPSVTDPATVERLQKQREAADKLSDQRTRQAEQTQKSAKEQGDQARLCEQARARMASYERPRVSVTDAMGTRVLGEEERQRELERSRAQVDELCK